MQRKSMLFVTLLLVTCSLFVNSRVYGQDLQSLIVPSEFTREQLNDEQLNRLVKLENKGQFSEFYYVAVQNLEETQWNGLLKLTIPGNDCSNLVFKAKSVEYDSETDYAWHGSLIDDKDDGTGCVMGELFLVNKEDDLIGHIVIDETVYELYDLTGGISVIALLDNEKTISIGCMMDDAPLIDNNTEKISGFNCKVRVLVLYTPAANAVEPSINSRINLALQQVRSGLTHSALYTWDFEVVEAGRQEINFTESTIENDIDVLEADPTAQALRSQFAADLVILLTDGNYGGVTGIATNGQNLIFDAAHAFAIVQTDWATTAGYTFAHEFGHLCGGRHDNDPDAGYAHAKIFHTGFWPFRTERRTIVTGASAGSAAVILNYSNPNVDYAGTSTGDAGYRDNARMMKDMACTIAGYDQNENYYVSIQGPGAVCPCKMAYYTAYVNAVPDPGYTFEWSRSWDGIHYSFVSNGIGYYFTQSCSYQQSPVYLKLKVTSPTGVIRTDVLAVVNSIATYSYIYPCNPHGVYWGPLYRQAGNHEEIYPATVIFPNPSPGEFTVNFYAEPDERISADIMDMQGRIVGTFALRNSGEGLNNESINVSSLINGIYQLKLHIGGATEMHQINLIK